MIWILDFIVRKIIFRDPQRGWVICGLIVFCHFSCSCIGKRIGLMLGCFTTRRCGQASSVVLKGTFIDSVSGARRIWIVFGLTLIDGAVKIVWWGVS